MSGSQSDDGFNKERADLFEALGHPLRLEILRALSESPLGFADLKRRVKVTSSGHLTHHLEKLDGLVMTTPDGLYSLSDDGREALRVVSTPKGTGSDKSHDDRKVLLSRTILAGLVAVMLLLASVAVVQELEVMDLSNRITSQNLPFSITTDFNSSVLQVIATPLTPVVSQGQNVTISVEVFNPLEYGLKATGHLLSTSCSGLSPVGAGVYFGYYTPENISEASPLSQVGWSFGGLCLSTGTNVANYTFYPHSDMALSSLDNNTTTAEVQELFTMSGYYAWVRSPPIAYQEFQTFPPGTYTVLASDIWGHQALCYFQVTG